MTQTTTPTDVLALHRPTAILTPKGDAVRLLYKLVAALGVLDQDDRQAVRDLFEAEMDGE